MLVSTQKFYLFCRLNTQKRNPVTWATQITVFSSKNKFWGLDRHLSRSYFQLSDDMVKRFIYHVTGCPQLKATRFVHFKFGLERIKSSTGKLQVNHFVFIPIFRTLCELRKFKNRMPRSWTVRWQQASHGRWKSWSPQNVTIFKTILTI